MIKYLSITIIAFGLSFLAFSGSNANDLENVSNSYTELNDNNRPLAVIRRFNPDVLIKRIDQDWEDAENAKPLFSADSLITAETGFALIQFLDNSTVRMRPNSLLVMGGEPGTRGNTTKNLSLDAGEIFFTVTGIGSSTQVTTPSAVAAVRGTSFSTEVREDGSTTIIVFTGVVVVRPSNSTEEIEIGPGESITVESDGITYELSTLTEDELEELLRELESDSFDGPRTIELRFINADGEEEIIIIEFEEN